MLQIYVYDDTGASFELDLYQEEPLKLTLSAEDIGDIPRVNSAFSKQFRVPATQTNSRVFQWWYEVNTIDFDITRRVRADLYSDGLFYKSGHIRIQNAYVNQETSQVDLELVFFGETRDFASQIGDITLDKLNLSQYNHDLNITTVKDSWDGNLANGAVRYIVANRGYDYEDDGSLVDQAEVADDQFHTYSFLKSNHPLRVAQMTPMIQAKVIIDAIFDQTEYSYSSDSFFNDTLFENLYTDGLPDASARISLKDGYVNTLSTGQEFRFTTDVLFPNEIEDTSGIFNHQTSRLFIPSTAVYDITTSLDLRLQRSILNTTVFYRVNIMRSTAGVETELATTGDLTTPAGIFPYNTTVNLSYDNGGAPIPQSTGADDYIFVRIITTSSNHQILADSSLIVTPDSVLNQFVAVSKLLKFDVKCIDFLKSILSKFKLIMVPSPDNEFEFVIKPWKDYIGSGDRFDWTEKLDTSKDVTLKPIFFEQSQLIDFTDVPDEDMRNKPFQEEAGRTYGALQFDSDNDMLSGTRKIETVFAPTPVDVPPGYPSTSDFVIPYFAKEGTQEADHSHLQELPMKVKPRLLFWNGKVTLPASEYWWLSEVGGTNAEQIQVQPRMTPYSVFPTDATTLNLNWFRDEPYFTDPNLGESVYERYWNQYVQELYSPLARVFTGYFNLDSNDLRTLSFNDVIFIENAYYRVLKVYDAPIADIQTVKVDLVKILDTITFANNGDPSPGGGGIDDVVVVGGGGTPVDPPAVEYYYLATDCDGVLAPITVQSNSPLAAGVVVSVSGSGYLGTCWTIADFGTAPHDTTVLDVFATCIECQSL